MTKFKFTALVCLLVTFFGGGAVFGAPSYFQRMEDGFPNQVKLYTVSYQVSHPFAEAELKIPQLIGVGNHQWQEKFNQELQAKQLKLAEEIIEEARRFFTDQEGEYSAGIPWNISSDYEVKLNKGGLLSLVITNYTYTGGAHGFTWVDYINLDLTNGYELSLRDLFRTEEELAEIAQVVDARVKEDPLWFFVAEFTTDLIREDQDFYLTDDSVVVCFGLYEIGPYAAGIQEFAVPVR